MTVTVTATTLLDSERSTVRHFFLESDAAADLSNTVLFDPVDYDPAWTDSALVRVEFGLQGFAVKLSFDGSPDLPVCVIPDTAFGVYDFNSVGGLRNRTSPGTGKLLVTTLGAAASDFGFLIVTIEKRTKVESTP